MQFECYKIWNSKTHDDVDVFFYYFYLDFWSTEFNVKYFRYECNLINGTTSD